MIYENEILMILEKDYKGSDTWRGDLSMYGDDSFLFVEKETNQILAEIAMIDDFSYMKIDNFEVKPGIRREGIARECIKLFMDYVISLGKKGLTGDSTQEATPFWHRIGAEIIFLDDCNDCDGDCDSCEYYDEDELNEFTLKPRSFYSYYETRKK